MYGIWGKSVVVIGAGNGRDVIMGTMASQITGISIVCWYVCSGADQRKLQGSASPAFLRGIHRGPVVSPHKGPVTGKIFPFDDVIISPNRRLISARLLLIDLVATNFSELWIKIQQFSWKRIDLEMVSVNGGINASLSRIQLSQSIQPEISGPLTSQRLT